MMMINTAFLTSKFEIGLMGTLSGMLMVFLALILISLIISQFHRLNGKKKETVVMQPEPSLPVVEEQEVDETDDLELVAVITAAVAASLNTSSDQLVVRSLRRVSKSKSAWNATGRSENLQNNVL